MQQSFWNFYDENLNISIPRVSNYFNANSVVKAGDLKEGQIDFRSYHDVDKIWGAYATVVINWETIDPLSYHHGIRVKESIDMYATIGVVAANKENSWHQSHEMTIWYGNRQKIKQRRMYMSNIIHASFYCDHTSRLFDIHVDILRKGYNDFKKLTLDFINSFRCHEV
jgi:hypothetical protein